MTHAPRITVSLILICLCAGCLCAGCSSTDSAGNSSDQVADKIATADVRLDADAHLEADVRLDIVDYEGVLERIKSHAGRLVVLDAWSTSCGPCVKEFPNLVALSRKYPDRIACISLSFDYYGVGSAEDYRQPVHAFLKRQQATFDNLMSSVESEVMYRKFNIIGPPVVFVFGRDGQLLKRFDSSSGDPFTYNDVEVFLVTQLAAKPAG
jgi:thiol-disulfide isomerase/thioredoxin